MPFFDERTLTREQNNCHEPEIGSSIWRCGIECYRRTCSAPARTASELESLGVMLRMLAARPVAPGSAHRHIQAVDSENIPLAKFFGTIRYSRAAHSGRFRFQRRRRGLTTSDPPRQRAGFVSVALRRAPADWWPARRRAPDVRLMRSASRGRHGAGGVAIFPQLAGPVLPASQGNSRNARLARCSSGCRPPRDRILRGNSRRM